MKYDLQEALEKEGYICERNLVSAIEAALSCRPTAGAFLFGPAGSGKTFLAETVARVLGRKQYFFQCFPGTREDDLLVKLIPDEKAQSGIAAYDGPVLEAAKTSRRSKVILTLDEWDKTRPSADSFLLDFLQSGRIRFNGRSCQARPENLTVFLTLNDEREISEPLLRRLPMIQFSHLPTHQVREALTISHAGHSALGAALVLYERCLMAGMSKPATIQELRQLLDAITQLGPRADWDSLVFQFITKTRENHTLLHQVEGMKTRSQQEERVRLEVTAYEAQPQEPKPAPAEPPRMPRLAETRGIVSVAAATGGMEGIESMPNLAEVGGIVALSDESYDTIASLVTQPGEQPQDLPGVGRVVGRNIILSAPVSLADYAIMVPLSHTATEGEIVFTYNFSLGFLQSLRLKGLKIVSFSKHEILAKAEGVDLRAVPAGADWACEIIVSLAQWKNFISLFNLPEILHSRPPVACIWGESEYFLQADIPPAHIIISRDRQNAANLDDKMVVKATICLPEINGRLHPNLQFGQRVEIARYTLVSSWGGGDMPGYQQRACEFSASTWQTAGAHAYTWAVSELTQLRCALDTRKEAKENA